MEAVDDPVRRGAEDVLSTLRGLGVSPRRIELFQHLREAGEASVPEIVEGIGGSVSGVRKHVLALEELGLLQRSLDRADGSFRPVCRFRIDSERAEDIAWMLFEALVPAT